MLPFPMAELIDNLVRGAVRVFDPSGILTRPEPRGRARAQTEAEAVGNALREDWESVGNDLKLVIRRFRPRGEIKE